MAKQIKAYVEVEPYVEVVQGRGSDPAALLASTLVVDDFGDALARLAEAATGAGTPTRILSGPHGTGKSTLLTVLYALAGFPDLRSRSQPQGIRTATSYFSGVRLVPIFVDPTESNAASFDAAVAEAVAAASAPASAAGIAASEWETAATSADPIAHALRLLPPGGRLVVIVDGVSSWIRVAAREAARDVVAALS